MPVTAISTAEILAENVPIMDAGGYFTAQNVEDALAEIITSRLVQRFCIGGSASQAQGLTRYYGLASVMPNSTEAPAQTKHYGPSGVAKNLRLLILANTMSGGTVVTFRKNGADTALALNIPNGTLGAVENITNTVSVAAGDLLALKVVTTGSGFETFQFVYWQVDIWGA